MVKASELYAGNYLTAADLPPGKKFPVRIFDVSTEQVAQGTDRGSKLVPRLVLSLTSPNGRAWPKTLMLNTTNQRTLSAAYDDETDAWPGKSIVIWNDPNVTFGGKRTGGVRVDVPPPQAANGAGAPASPPASPPAPAAPTTPPTTGSEPAWPGSDAEISDEVPF